MNAIQRTLAALGLLLSAVLGVPTQAAPITLNFSGTVTQTSFDPYDPLLGAVAPGKAFYSYLNFDTSAADAAPSPHLGSYTLSGFPYGFAAIVGPILFPVMSTVNISIVDGEGGGPDQFSVFASEGVAGGLGDYISISILLQDDTGSAFSNDLLPAGMPDLSRFSVRSFDLSGQYTDLNNTFFQYEVMGKLAVPEPAAPGLLALALLGCAAGARRAQRPRRPAASAP